MACDRGHTHLIVFMHACGYYSRAAIISFAELNVRLLFEGGYYSGCSFYSNKYGSCNDYLVLGQCGSCSFMYKHYACQKVLKSCSWLISTEDSFLHSLPDVDVDYQWTGRKYHNYTIIYNEKYFSDDHFLI